MYHLKGGWNVAIEDSLSHLGFDCRYSIFFLESSHQALSLITIPEISSEHWHKKPVKTICVCV